MKKIYIIIVALFISISAVIVCYSLLPKNETEKIQEEETDRFKIDQSLCDDLYDDYDEFVAVHRAKDIADTTEAIKEIKNDVIRRFIEKTKWIVYGEDIKATSSIISINGLVQVSEISSYGKSFGVSNDNAEIWCMAISEDGLFYCEINIDSGDKYASHRYDATYRLDKSSDLENKIVLKLIDPDGLSCSEEYWRYNKEEKQMEYVSVNCSSSTKKRIDTIIFEKAKE